MLYYVNLLLNMFQMLIYPSIQMHKTSKHTTHKNVQEQQDTTRLQEHIHSEPHRHII